MQMRPVPMKNWWICRFLSFSVFVREHTRNTGNKQPVHFIWHHGWRGKVKPCYDDLDVSFYVNTPQILDSRKQICSKTIAPVGANPGNDSQQGLVFSFQPTFPNHYCRFFFFFFSPGVVEQNKDFSQLSSGCSPLQLYFGGVSGLADHWSTDTKKDISQHGISAVHSEYLPSGFWPVTAFKCILTFVSTGSFWL